MARGATFTAPTALLAVSHPTVSSVGDLPQGPIIGMNLDDGSPFRFDPWLLMEERIIKALTVLVIAPINAGKSALIKLIIKRLMNIAPGSRTLHGAINDYRTDGDGTEYAKLGAYLNCTVTRMRDMQLNFFDPRLYLNDKGEVSLFTLVETVQRIAEAGSTPLDDLEMTALRIVTDDLTRTHEKLWGLKNIARLSGGIDAKAYATFREQDTTSMHREIARQLINISDEDLKSTLRTQHRRIMASADNLNLADLQAAGVRLRNRLEKVYNVTARGIFGSEHSFYDLATQPVSVRDWRGLSPAAESLLRLVMSRIEIAAIDNNRRELLGDFRVNDELHRAMKDPQFVTDLLYGQQVARSLSRLEFGGTHTPDSILMGDGELYRMSETIMNNTGVFVFGKLPRDEAIQQQAMQYASLDKNEVNRLVNLPLYGFGIKYNPTLPLVTFRATPYGDDFGLIETNTANKAKAGSVGNNPEALAKFAAVNGARYKGEK